MLTSFSIVGAVAGMPVVFHSAVDSGSSTSTEAPQHLQSADGTYMAAQIASACSASAKTIAAVVPLRSTVHLITALIAAPVVSDEGTGAATSKPASSSQEGTAADLGTATATDPNRSSWKESEDGDFRCGEMPFLDDMVSESNGCMMYLFWVEYVLMWCFVHTHLRHGTFQSRPRRANICKCVCAVLVADGTR